MASNKDKKTLLSTLKHIEQFEKSNDNEMRKYLNLMLEFTESETKINEINSYKNGEMIAIFVNLINNITDIEILSQSIIILGRILSHCENAIFSAMFITNNGIQCLYNKVLSRKYNNKQRILYSLVDFLFSINQNTEIGQKQIVLNNTEFQFIFQIASILKKNIKFDKVINKFSQLLCKLYHQHNHQHNDSEDEQSDIDDDDDDDDDEEDENNIKSIINTLIFTGFINTISKRTKMIKTDSPNDIMAMMDMIMVLMDCNSKKTCNKLLNASIIKRMLQFLNQNKSKKQVLSKTFDCLTKFYTHSNQSTLRALEDNNYMYIIGSISKHIKSKEIFLSHINPSSFISVSPSDTSLNGTVSINEEQTLQQLEEQDEEKETATMSVDISEQEDMSTVIEEIESDYVSPNISQPQPQPQPQSQSQAQPPPAQTQNDSMDSASEESINLPPIPVISPRRNGAVHKQSGSSNESEMELVLDAISDIQSTITNLQQNIDKTPQIGMVKKYVSEHHAPRYSGIEQQHFIDTETTRIMAERKAEQERSQLAEIQEVEEKYSDSEEEKPPITYKKRHKSIKAPSNNRKTKKRTMSNHTSNGNDKLWNKFGKYYAKYIESRGKNAGDYVESLRDILQKLREFAGNGHDECIDGLLHCHSSNIIIVHFLSCLEIKDDLIRECIVEILDNLYDVADENFIKFTNENNVIQYLSKSLMVRHHHLSSKAPNDNDLFTLTAASSARVDMKILQVLAVNFSGKEILYHTVFNKIKQSIISPYQHIDFVLYALQVIKTIIEDIDNAQFWINRDCKHNMQMDRTVQFAVYVIQTHGAEAADLSKGILRSLHVDINKAVLESGGGSGGVEEKKRERGHGHAKQVSNFYKKLEREQIKNSDLEYKKLRDWIIYIQQECDKSRVNNGILNDNEAIIHTLMEIKAFFMSNNNDYIWKLFKNLNAISVLCDLITIILMGNNSLWSGLLIGILDIIVLCLRQGRDRQNVRKSSRDSNDNGYIIKCMIDILLRYLSISSKINKVMMRACGILEKMTKENDECIAFAVDYGGIECIFNIIISWNTKHFNNKLLIISSLNVLNNLISWNGSTLNDKNKKIIMNAGGCQHILNILSTLNNDEESANNAHAHMHEYDDHTIDIITITFQLLLNLTNINNEITCNLILILINQYSILTVLYSAIELLQKDKKTLYLLMQLLLNMCRNCNKLSVDVMSWIIRIVLEFSNKYEKSPQIHQFMIKIITAIIQHNPANNIQLILNNNNQSANNAIMHILETMKLSQYKETIVFLVFEFILLIVNISNEYNNYFVSLSKGVNIFKFIVHVMKNWYLNKKENVESKVLIIKNCCQIITNLCNSSPNESNANIANQSHVTSSLIKLIIAHTDNDEDDEDKKENELQRNPYLNRISMFICILESINALCKTPEIALKIAKHAIKTITKTLEYHIFISAMNDSYNKQQKKVLLVVVLSFMTNIVSIQNNISSYLIKYDIGQIVYKSLVKYHDPDGSSDEDLSICCKLIDFLSVLLSVNNKSYNVLESNMTSGGDIKSSKLIANILTKQTASYRTYQPLVESCNTYNKMVQQCIHKINNKNSNSVPSMISSHSQHNLNNNNNDPASPIPIIQSTTSSAPAANNYNYNPYYQPVAPPHNAQIAHPQLHQFPYSMPNVHNVHNVQNMQMRPHPQMIAMPNMGYHSMHNLSHNNISPHQQQQPQAPMSIAAMSQQLKQQQHQQQQAIKQQKKRSNTVPTQAEQIKMFQNGANPYHTLTTTSPVVWNSHQNNKGHAPSQSDQVANKLHSALVQLLSNGSIMTKYPSIHTATPNYLHELNRMKAKFKLVRISSDWQTIEFHNVANEQMNNNNNNSAKPPKVLPIGNMRHIDSSFCDKAVKEKRFSKAKHSKELLIYALDKNGKEIVIKLVCQNINDTKRWSRALTQIINHFK